MPRGEKLFEFLPGPGVDRFYGTVTVRLEAGKVTRLASETSRAWQYKRLPYDLPEGE